jgi:hypothetical protein
MRKLALLTLLASSLGIGQAVAQTVAALPLGGGATLPYYVSAPPGAPGIVRVLIGMHGYTRDANRTFDAADAAAQGAGQRQGTLIVAPIFPVPPPEAAKCSFKGVPQAGPTDALWRCGNWSGGGKAANAAITSFGAMDRLVAAILAGYPGVQRITIAGFSAGAQFVQRYAAFAATPPRAVALRYVVADPSGFLYFDPQRPLPGAAQCPAYDDWKFGTKNLPADLGRDAAAARTAYAAADLHYLEGALNTGSGRGTAYRLLESGCAAEVQGQYRLDRGQHYAAYDAASLAHGAHTLTTVPGCAHSVTCVFPSLQARAALFGAP